MEKTEYIQTRPVDAHPSRPVHLIKRVHFTEHQRIGNRIVETQHHLDEWCGSYPTPEIAEGQVLIRTGKI